MLIRPKLFNSRANLSISALNAVTCITTDLFVLSRITGLNFLHIFLTFSTFLEFAKILNKANSLNKISFSPRLKSATLWTGTSFLSCKFICSITCGVPSVTIVTEGTPQVIEQINLQLKKLVPVHKVADFKRGEKDILFRELAMFKILGNTKKIEKVKKICKKFNPVILDKTKKSVVIQVTALRAEIDKLALDLKSLGLISTSRTGAVAMTKGSKIFS